MQGLSLLSLKINGKIKANATDAKQGEFDDMKMTEELQCKQRTIQLIQNKENLIKNKGEKTM